MTKINEWDFNALNAAVVEGFPDDRAAGWPRNQPKVEQRTSTKAAAPKGRDDWRSLLYRSLSLSLLLLPHNYLAGQVTMQQSPYSKSVRCSLVIQRLTLI